MTLKSISNPTNQLTEVPAEWRSFVRGWIGALYRDHKYPEARSASWRWLHKQVCTKGPVVSPEFFAEQIRSHAASLQAIAPYDIEELIKNTLESYHSGAQKYAASQKV